MHSSSKVRALHDGRMTKEIYPAVPFRERGIETGRFYPESEVWDVSNSSLSRIMGQFTELSGLSLISSVDPVLAERMEDVAGMIYIGNVSDLSRAERISAITGFIASELDIIDVPHLFWRSRDALQEAATRTIDLPEELYDSENDSPMTDADKAMFHFRMVSSEMLMQETKT